MTPPAERPKTSEVPFDPEQHRAAIEQMERRLRERHHVGEDLPADASVDEDVSDFFAASAEQLQRVVPHLRADNVRPEAAGNSAAEVQDRIDQLFQPGAAQQAANAQAWQQPVEPGPPPAPAEEPPPKMFRPTSGGSGSGPKLDLKTALEKLRRHGVVRDEPAAAAPPPAPTPPPARAPARPAPPAPAPSPAHHTPPVQQASPAAPSPAAHPAPPQHGAPPPLPQNRAPAPSVPAAPAPQAQAPAPPPSAHAPPVRAVAPPSMHGADPLSGFLPQGMPQQPAAAPAAPPAAGPPASPGFAPASTPEAASDTVRIAPLQPSPDATPPSRPAELPRDDTIQLRPIQIEAQLGGPTLAAGPPNTDSGPLRAAPNLESDEVPTLEPVGRDDVAPTTGEIAQLAGEALDRLFNEVEGIVKETLVEPASSTSSSDSLPAMEVTGSIAPPAPVAPLAPDAPPAPVAPPAPAVQPAPATPSEDHDEEFLPVVDEVAAPSPLSKMLPPPEADDVDEGEEIDDEPPPDGPYDWGVKKPAAAPGAWLLAADAPATGSEAAAQAAAKAAAAADASDAEAAEEAPGAAHAGSGGGDARSFLMRRLKDEMERMGPVIEALKDRELITTGELDECELGTPAPAADDREDDDDDDDDDDLSIESFATNRPRPAGSEFTPARIVEELRKLQKLRSTLERKGVLDQATGEIDLAAADAAAAKGVSFDDE